VTVFKIGQRVAVDPNNGCNKCDHCHNANYHYCAYGGINNTIGIFKDGGWATHALVPETQVHTEHFKKPGCNGFFDQLLRPI